MPCALCSNYAPWEINSNRYKLLIRILDKSQNCLAQLAALITMRRKIFMKLDIKLPTLIIGVKNTKEKQILVQFIY